MKLVSLMLFSVLLLAGCGADSLLPWLTQDYKVACNRDWLGEWYVSPGGSKQEHRVVISLKEQPQRNDLKVKERYNVRVRSPDGKRNLQLMGHLFEVNGVKLLMLMNFARPREWELTSVVTSSLWRVEGDKDNLVLWIPEFVIDIFNETIEPDVEMVRAGHELEQPVFVDTTEHLQAFVEKWTKTYEGPKVTLSLNLHRKGKVFTMPQGAIKQG